MISGCRRWKWLPVVAGGGAPVLSSGGAGSRGDPHQGVQNRPETGQRSAKTPYI